MNAKAKKYYAYGTAGLLILLLASYLVLWIYSAQWLKGEIGRLYKKAAADGVEFIGPEPQLANFPFVPEIHYSGGIKFNNVEILFPEMKLRGYPVPNATLQISFPKGISLGGVVDPALWSLDMLQAKIAVPFNLPRSFFAEDLQAWYDREGKIDIRAYHLTKNALDVGGKGYFLLDKNLQPVVLLESVLNNHSAFLEDQVSKGTIPPFASAIATGLLESLSQTDPKTGEKTVGVTISVQNRWLRVGPVQLIQLPMIVWDTRMPPAQPL